MIDGFSAIQLGHAVVHGLIALLINPILYLGMILLMFDLRKTAKAERKFFGVRLTRLRPPVIWQTLCGLLAGVLCSAVLYILGAVVTESEVIVVSLITLIALAVRLRLLLIHYAVGLLCVLKIATAYWPRPASGFLTPVWDFLNAFHSSSWLAISGLLSVASAILIFVRRRSGTPAVVISKRGGTIGAFVVQLAFVSALFVPIAGSDFHTWSGFSGIPLLASASGLTLSAIPVFTGISAVFTTVRPEQGIRSAVAFQFVLGILLLAGAYATLYVAWVGVVVGLVLCIAATEVFLWWLTRRESLRDPLFAETNQGVKILATIKGSLSHSMGLLPGEIISHVNQVPVHSTYDLHFALDQNPAYAKLQVMDWRGEIRFVGKPVYAGERHQLGIVFSPGTNDRIGYRSIRAGLLQSVYFQIDVAGERKGDIWNDVASTSPDM